MTHKERWLNTYHYKPVDHVTDMEFGYWAETLVRWHDEGLPAEITHDGLADQYFGFAPTAGVPVHLGIIPGFEYKVLEEHEDHRIIQDGDGAICMVRTDGGSTIPKYLEFPIKDWDSWKSFKERFNADDPARVVADWDKHVEYLNNVDVPVIIGLGSLFGTFRNWTGFEHIAILCMDHPDLIEDMVVTFTEFTLKMIAPAVRDIKIDGGSFWEDICFNHGCIISPKMFKQWLTPHYKMITDAVKKAGADVFYVDCDGNIMNVMTGWLEGGVNCMFPIEVAGGSDPVEIRKIHGKGCLLMGGVNKRALAAGKDAIDREIARLVPLVEEGGFIPHVDHRCPPDVSFEDYKYYLKRKRSELGIPEPAPWEERKG